MDYEEIYTQEELDDRLTVRTSLYIEVNACNGRISDLALITKSGATALRIRPDDSDCLVVEVRKPLPPGPEKPKVSVPSPTRQWRLHGTVRPIGIVDIEINEIFDEFALAESRRYDLRQAFGHNKCTLNIEAVDFNEQAAKDLVAGTDL